MIGADAVFDGYRVERILGSGGMGVVYEAVQASLDRRVALKVLRPELADDPAFVERFRREGRLQAAIEHPHVLDVYEVGESSSHGLYLSMMLVEGPTLADLQRAGALDAERTLRLLEQVAGALDAAHAAGLLHRDVKPQNILVAEGDRAFLADFGISRAGGDPATSTRPILGTMAYVAPEVIRGDAPEPATDRYAFAAMLFHCLTGNVVFPRGSEASVLFAHASEPPPRISERRRELPTALDPVFEDALAKDPEERPGSATELVTAVRDALGPDAVASLGAPDLSAEPEPPTAAGPPPAIGGPRPSPRGDAADKPSRWRTIGLVALVALLTGGLGAGAATLLGGDVESAAQAEDIPELADGAQALGSELGATERTLGCRGGEPVALSAPCAIVQTDLPGGQLLVPADGTIVGWSVLGASGEIALDVIRPDGKDTTRIARSQWESAGNRGAFRFPANIAVERGDLIGLELGPGAGVGIKETDDATTQRWLEPVGGGFGAPDRESGTGFDYELLLRADFVPGAEAEVPERITGAAAANAPDGNVRRRAEVEISKPPSTVTVQLAEVGDRVALDLLRGGRRTQRTFVPDLVPGGEPIDLKQYPYEGQGFSEVDVYWVNPSTGRLIFHFFNVSQREIQFVG